MVNRIGCITLNNVFMETNLIKYRVQSEIHNYILASKVGVTSIKVVSSIKRESITVVSEKMISDAYLLVSENFFICSFFRNFDEVQLVYALKMFKYVFCNRNILYKTAILSMLTNCHMQQSAFVLSI